MTTQETLSTRLKHGMRTKIAKALGITPQAVGQWERVPAERVIAVSKITGIPPQELRPDLYPDMIDPTGETQP